MTKGHYYISVTIDQAEAMIDALKVAIKAAKLIKQEQAADDPECNPKIEMKSKDYCDGNNDCDIEFDITIKY